MPKPFPEIDLDITGSDANPAIRLFGRRFFSDQTTLELLIELLLVATSPKKTGGKAFDSMLPPLELLKDQWENPLDYSPRARLNLKLFSFFGASKIDSRHETHRNHLKEIEERLREKVTVSNDSKDSVLKTVENLFLGFHGAGMQRTWCAQSFMPLCRNMVACESIWKQTQAQNLITWSDALNYFSHRQALFLARGGEVLYLQLCNALRQDKYQLEIWLKANGLYSLLTNQERNPALLHSTLEKELNKLMKETPETVSKLAEFIDRASDEETSLRTDTNGSPNFPRWSHCGWCPEEAWPESYLFAVELSRVCRAKLDLMDRLELLETLCALHVMRSLATQAARYSAVPSNLAWPYFKIAVSDPNGRNETVKKVSRATSYTISKLIYDGLRHPEIFERTPPHLSETLYKEADRRYGHKLFISLGKRIGMIVPKKGAGMRFVLNDRILRLLIVTMSPGLRITYETFKQAAEAHFGLAFDDEALVRANAWATGISIESFGTGTDDWLVRMLEEAGALRKLSDSCALIENTAAQELSEVER